MTAFCSACSTVDDIVFNQLDRAKHNSLVEVMFKLELLLTKMNGLYVNCCETGVVLFKLFG